MIGSSRSAGVLLTAVLFAATVLYVLIAFLPMHRAITSIRHDLAAVGEGLGDLSRQAARLEQAKAELQATRQYTDHWQAHLHPVDQVGVVFGEISRSADGAGVAMHRFAPQPSVPLRRIHKVPLQLQCSGSFAQFGAFLQSLEGLGELIWIDELEFEKVGNPEDPLRMNLKITIFADRADISG
jgi:Tfp pilus assembly protein PilO